MTEKCLIANKVLFRTLNGVWEKMSSKIEKMKKRGDIKGLIKISLKNKHETVRNEAIKALSEIKDEIVIEQFTQALYSKNYDIFRNATVALGGLRDNRAVEPLIEALQKISGSLKEYIIEALGEIKDPRAVEPLIQLLQDDFKPNRWKAIKALGKIKDNRALEAIINALKTQYNYHIRWTAAEVLGEYKNIKAVEPLIQALKDNYENTRRAAAEALGKLKDARAVDPLIQALGDKDEYVRAYAAWSLGELREQRALEPLTRIRNDKEFGVRTKVFDAIKKIKSVRIQSRGSEILNTENIEIIIEALRDKDEDVRLYTVNHLQFNEFLNNPRIIEPLSRLLDDEDRRVRLAAVFRLSEIKDEKVIHPLSEALKSRDEFIRENAAEGLTKFKINDPRVIESLIYALTDEDKTVGMYALNALHKIDYVKGIKIIEPLIQILQDSNETSRLLNKYTVKEILDKIDDIKDIEAIRPLEYALNSKFEEVRFTVIQILGKIKNEKVIPSLTQALKNNDEKIRAEAAILLGKTKNISAVEPLKQALNDEYFRVQENAEEALKQLAKIKTKEVPISEEIIGETILDDNSNFFISFFSGNLSNYGEESYLRLLNGISKVTKLEKLAFWSGDLLIKDGFKNLLSLESNIYAHLNNFTRAISNQDIELFPGVAYLIFVFSKNVISMKNLNDILKELAPLKDMNAEYWGLMSFRKNDFNSIIEALANCGVSGDTKLEITTNGNYIWRDKLIPDHIMNQFFT